VAVQTEQNAESDCHRLPARFMRARVAIVTPAEPEVGGMTVQAHRLAEGLSREGIDAVRVPLRGSPGWVDKVLGLRTIYHFCDRIRRLTGLAGKIDGVIVLSCAGYYFDLVTVPAVLLCLARSIPVVVSDRGGDTEEWLARSWRARRTFRLVAALSRGVHVSSPYLQRVFAAHGIGAEAVPIVLHPESFAYRPRSASADLIVNNRTMSRYHGVPLLVRVFAEVARQRPTATLVITGSGVQLNECRRLAADSGLTDRVRFAGELSQAEMACLLGSAGLVVNTSTHDNIPNAILEAFASGVPVVSSGAGGIPDLIGNDERGCLVHDRSVESFVAAINRSIAQPARTLAQVAAAKRLVDGMTWEMLRDDYLRVLIKPLLACRDSRKRSQVPS
jgi:glycosyltransferase involved in cell wall biosynthesis